METVTEYEIDDVLNVQMERDVLPYKEIKRQKDGTERIVDTLLPGPMRFLVTLKSGEVIGINAEEHDRLVGLLRERGCG